MHLVQEVNTSEGWVYFSEKKVILIGNLHFPVTTAGVTAEVKGVTTFSPCISAFNLIGRALVHKHRKQFNNR